jgi:prolyl oligopeptidase
LAGWLESGQSSIQQLATSQFEREEKMTLDFWQSMKAVAPAGWFTAWFGRGFRGRFMGLLLATSAASALAATPIARAAPVAPVRMVTDQLHGVAVPDPYRYMENQRDPQVQAWMKAQGDEARKTLDHISVRSDILKRLQTLDAQQGDSVRDVVRSGGGQLFYLKRKQGEPQFKLVMRPSLQGAEKVLVDTAAIAKRKSVPHAINYFAPSWDGKHVAYGMSAGGSEDASLYVLNVATGKTVGQPVPRVPEALVSWLPDSQSLTFNQLKKLKPGEPETEVYMDSRVLWLRLGQNEKQAVAIFGPTVNRQLGLARLDVGTVQFRPGSPWMLARTSDTTLPEGFLFVARVAELGKSKEIPWHLISRYEDKITDVVLQGDDAYLLTYTQAPRNRVLKLNLNLPVLTDAEEVAVAPPGMVLEGFTLNKNAIVGSVREGTSIGIRLYSPGDKTGVAVPMPYPGAAHVYADPSQAFDDVIYNLGGWTQPSRSWRFNGSQNEEIQLKTASATAPAPDIEVRDVLAKSHDGAMVPMTILHKKGLVKNSANPTLLVGYGAYGFSETAHYSAGDRVWVERGGVLAYANVRGSGVYGQDWYHAGQKATKANTWKDGIACAEFLVADGYASPATMAVLGGSAGGIFAGRSLTQAPQLFAAGIVQVGVIDAVRAEESANGITNISEFGSYKNPQEFAALLEMSAYHQIKDGVAYPAVMFMHGLNDPRVDVWHSAKGTARLQAASSSGKPVLLRLDAQAGHGIGSTATQRQQMVADEYGFLLWQMGFASVNR